MPLDSNSLYISTSSNLICYEIETTSVSCFCHRHWLRRVAYSLFHHLRLGGDSWETEGKRAGLFERMSELRLCGRRRDFWERGSAANSKNVSPGISAGQEAAAINAVASFVKAFSRGCYEDLKPSECRPNTLFPKAISSLSQNFYWKASQQTQLLLLHPLSQSGRC